MPVAQDAKQNGQTESFGRKAGTVRFRKRNVVILVAVLVVVIGAFAGMKRTGTNGTYGYSSVEPASEKYEDFAVIAEQTGYPEVKLPETFTDGYQYKGVFISTCQEYDEQSQKMTKTYKTLRMEYRLEGVEIDISISPARSKNDLDGYETAKRTQAVYEWDGVTVYQTLYVSLEPPYTLDEDHWMEAFTEEELQMVEDGIAYVNGPGIYPEPYRKDYHSFIWQQGDYIYIVSAGYYYTKIVTIEEMERIAQEIVELNRSTGGNIITEFFSGLFK